MAEASKKKKFLEAYHQYADAIYRHCFFRTYSKGRAEELTQETFMRAWQYMNGYSATDQGPDKRKEIKNMRAFLYQIATNLIIDESRKKKELSLDAIMEEPVSFEPTSEEHSQLEQEVLVKEILAVVQALPEDSREVLIMRYVDDLTPKEIAEILGISANNASVKINRALQTLKKIVNQKS
jgi:RNA polymerase sigma-70 factor (ECF subfamily)